jgi:hypothetical protein
MDGAELCPRHEVALRLVCRGHQDAQGIADVADVSVIAEKHIRFSNRQENGRPLGIHNIGAGAQVETFSFSRSRARSLQA